MSFSVPRRVNRGAYASPFSGVGCEFLPLGVLPDHSGIALHEAGYVARLQRWRFPNVLSPFWRLYYDFAPGHKVILGRREVPLGPGRIMLIPDHCLFHCQGENSVPCLWLHFSCSQRPTPAQPVPILLRPTQTERSLMADLVAQFQARRRGENGRRIFSLGVALLEVVLSRPEIRWQDNVSETLGAAIRHVEQHYSEPLYTPKLAALAHLSPGAFTRLFRRQRGMTPARFVVQVRVREAAHLLLGTGLALDEIASRTGFPNAFYFSRVFKRITGETPSRFRQLHALAVSSDV